MILRDLKVESRDVPIGLILPPDLPSRSTMDEEKLDELARDIALKGVLQPLILAPAGDRYKVFAGHRRFLASLRAGLVAVPARIYPDDVAALEAVKYSENRFREDLNPAEEAVFFAELLERDCGDDVDRLCELLGEKRGYVENRLLLIRGDEKIFEALQRNLIRVGVAMELNKCTDELRRRSLLRAAIEGGATQTLVMGWITEWKKEQAYSTGVAPAPMPASSVAPVPETNYFTCACCGRTDNVHLMRPINMHEHCRLAIFEPLLAAARGEH